MSSPSESSVPASDDQSGAGTSVSGSRTGVSDPGTIVPSPDTATGFSWKKLAVAMSPLAFVPVLVWLGIPLCPSRSMFGVPCPGCGLTRATLAMLELDFHHMLEMHPLAPLVTPLVVWWMASAMLTSAGLKSAARWDPGKVLPRPFWAIVAVVMLGLFVLRLAGLFGGLPDRVDPASGLWGRLALAIASLFS